MMRLWIGVLFLCLGTETAIAAPDGKATAMAVLEKARTTSIAMKTFYMEAQSTVTRTAGNPQYSQTKFWFTRPDHMLVTKQVGPIYAACYVNGKTFLAYNASRNEYDRRELKGPVVDELSDLQLTMPSIGRLLFTDASVNEILEIPDGLAYKGQETVNGTPCYVVTWPLKMLSATFYIDGNGYLRRSIVIGEQGTALGGFSYDSIYKFIPNQPIPETTYKFSPPPGAKEK